MSQCPTKAPFITDRLFAPNFCEGKTYFLLPSFLNYLPFRTRWPLLASPISFYTHPELWISLHVSSPSTELFKHRMDCLIQEVNSPVQEDGPARRLYLKRVKSSLYIPESCSSDHNPLPEDIPITRSGFVLLGSPTGPLFFYEIKAMRRVKKLHDHILTSRR